MEVPAALVTALQPWADFYGGSTVLSVALTFAHLGSMLVGGGLAISADRMVLRAATPTSPEMAVTLADTVGDVHRPVVVALIVSAVSGGLQLAADIEALGVSWVMWVKFGLLLALAANGALMLRDERLLRAGGKLVQTFGALRLRAITSGVLWLAITLAGVGLMQG